MLVRAMGKAMTREGMLNEKRGQIATIRPPEITPIQAPKEVRWW